MRATGLDAEGCEAHVSKSSPSIGSAAACVRRRTERRSGVGRSYGRASGGAEVRRQAGRQPGVGRSCGRVLGELWPGVMRRTEPPPDKVVAGRG
ncbi:hypothetical protein PR202_ga10020 [Eleusine coracana subsp. coracana]|uniref:Uncharacterized protein n=1 Tax=Eleusine coracana subsp. coracana TaxID=191504 RepID=A0AAV5C5N3_ELECO|nr:hypothetical protein PR202_ga10020 [Eleusine coracana subsp. coracana]